MLRLQFTEVTFTSEYTLFTGALPLLYLDTFSRTTYNCHVGGMAELADAADLKSAGLKTVWVRSPLPPPQG
jgi:hypothetical protein